MPGKNYNVLFLCTHNSARSILAESAMNRLGQGKFFGYSAGSQPSGRIHPYAIDLLGELGHDVDALRSKSWDEFAQPGAPQFDFIFTVCDAAADEVCPVWPGHPVSAHWGIADPSRVEGAPAAQRRAFSETLQIMSDRIRKFIALPFEELDSETLKEQLREIGKIKL